MRSLAAGLLLAITLVAPAGAGDDGALFARPQDAPAIAPLLGDLQAQLRQAAAVRGRFAQHKWLSELPRPLASSGSFLVARDLGVVWHTQQPFDSELVITPQGLVQRENGRETMRMSADRQPGLAAFAGVFYQFFVLDLSELQSRFALFGERAGDGWRLGLKPLAAALARTLQAVVIRGDTQVRQVQLQEAAGDRTEIDLSDVSLAGALSDAERAAFAP